MSIDAIIEYNYVITSGSVAFDALIILTAV